MYILARYIMLHVYVWYRLYCIVMHIVSSLFSYVFTFDLCDAAQQRPFYGLDSLSLLFFFLLLTAEARENAVLSDLGNLIIMFELLATEWPITQMILLCHYRNFVLSLPYHYAFLSLPSPKTAKNQTHLALFSHEWHVWRVQYINILSYYTLHLHIDCMCKDVCG